jgi:microcin C transport system substrate-binding protein
MGVRDPAVDQLLNHITDAKTRPQLISATRALDRVLRHGHFAVPHWYSGVHRVSWRSGKFEQPAILPRFYQPEAWVTATWSATLENREMYATAQRGGR